MTTKLKNTDNLKCVFCKGDTEPLFNHLRYCQKCEPYKPEKPKGRVIAKSDPDDPYGFQIKNLDDLDIFDDEPTVPDWKIRK